MGTPKLSPDRTFLHSLATPISIAKILTKKMISHLNGSKPEISDAEKLAMANKILNTINELEDLHGSHRQNIEE